MYRTLTLKRTYSFHFFKSLFKTFIRWQALPKNVLICAARRSLEAGHPVAAIVEIILRRLNFSVLYTVPVGIASTTTSFSSIVVSLFSVFDRHVRNAIVVINAIAAVTVVVMMVLLSLRIVKRMMVRMVVVLVLMLLVAFNVIRTIRELIMLLLLQMMLVVLVAKVVTVVVVNVIVVNLSERIRLS